MSTVDLHADDVARTVRVGDTVLVSGTVLEVSPGVGVLVELFSKTDQYRDWIREDRVVGLVVPDAPDEPSDGSWIVGPDSDSICGGGINVYHRNDAGATTEPERRYPRRWQVAGTGEWVDWPTAHHRGADPGRRLHDDGDDLDQTLRPVAAEIVRYLGRSHHGARTIGYIGRTMRQIDYSVTDDQIQQVIDWLMVRGQVELMPARTDQSNPRPRYQLRNTHANT